jgi:hypothetical protein
VIPFKLFFEQVLGLKETVTFKEIGPVEAKVDSGNGAYNVLHGTDIEYNGNKVKFRTIDNREIVKPLQELIDINIGSGNIEKRPVVLFDISIGDEDYPNTPFSITDRSQNEEQVLLGKDFIEKLGGLIDVRKTNVIS